MTTDSAQLRAPIAISLGDPAGIGPQIALQAAEAVDAPSILVGNPLVIQRAAQRLGMPLPAAVHAIAANDPVEPGKPGAASGEQAYQAVIAATALVQSGQARALTTAPLAKDAMQQAGHVYPGHTELLAELAGNTPVRMMLANPDLRVVLVTVHLPLRTALEHLSVDGIAQTIRIADAGLRQHGIIAPRLAVAGVNPHAGENGLFGDEESALVQPAIDQVRADGIDAQGPFPPDTVFMQARGLSRFDAVIAMYHDQGLIPVKYLGVADGVNVTLGLPFVRTSPDHGTAFDIAATNQADPASMIHALQMADQLSARTVGPAG